jgi:hypothetical protein
MLGKLYKLWLPNMYVEPGWWPMESVRVKRIEVHEGRVRVLKLDGGWVEHSLSEVRRLATCRAHTGELVHALVVKGGLLYRAQELSFKTTWIERQEPETGCIVYEGPSFEAASKLLLEASRKLREALELLSRPEVQSLVDYYNQYRGCSPEYTWVKNPAGTKYWYWYLKCPDRFIKSIYMGKSLGPFNTRLEAARVVADAAKRLLPALESIAGELEAAAQKLVAGELAEASEAGSQSS